MHVIIFLGTKDHTAASLIAHKRPHCDHNYCKAENGNKRKKTETGNLIIMTSYVWVLKHVIKIIHGIFIS